MTRAFLVNLANEGSQLREGHDRRLVKTVISLLSSKKAEQILTPQGKDTLRKEVRSKVNSLSPDLNVLEVYIVDFVVQL